MPSPAFRFPPFELQPVQRRLLRDGQPVPLRARAFDVLVVLVERAGDLVTKAELLDRVWPGLVVEENNIAAQIVALRKAIGNELIATVAGRGYRFTGDVASSNDEAPAPPPRAAAPVSRLIGRADDLVRLRDALGAHGCTTLVGPGGVGKTVLAREAVSDRAPTQRAWVDLATLADGSQVAGALYRALGIKPSDAPLESDAVLAAALADADRVVVLDNAEHVVDAVAALVSSLLVLTPSATLLVTSQVPLRVPGEQVLAIEPLRLPDDALSDDESFDTPAVQLLVERLRAADPQLALGAEARPLLRRLSVHLDGLPLALEMAAAMVPVLGLSGVLDALDERFAALRRGPRGASPRHQTLRAAVEWSHDLLADDTQRVFRRLGVFADAFPLDLAVAVAGDAAEDRWPVVDALTELVDRSLVVRLPVATPSEPPRFRLLETLRSLALEKLRASGEDEAVRSRATAALAAHLRAFADTPAAAAPDLAHVPGLVAWARTHEPVAAFALTLAAARVAAWTPWLVEASRWIAEGEPLLDASVPLAIQGEWWREFARYQTFVRGRRAVEAARNAAAIERTLGNDDGLFWSLIPLLRSCVLEPEDFDARRDEAKALLDRHPEWPARARVVYSGSLAMEYRRRNDFESAWRHQQDEVDEAERAGMREIADNALGNLCATLAGLGRHEESLARITALLARTGDVESPLGAYHRFQKLNALIGLRRLDEARAFAPEALQWGRRYDVPDIVQILAQLAALQGRVSVAATLLGHYRHRLAARGADFPSDIHSPWREATALVTAALDAATLQGLTERGAQLSAEAVDALFLDETDQKTTIVSLRRRTA